MRFIKAFLVGATGLFVVITLFSLLIPANVKVARNTTINSTDRNKIIAQVADLKNWKNWHPIFAAEGAVTNFGSISSGKNASCDVQYKDKVIHLLITFADSSLVSFILQSKGENSISNQIRLYPLEGLNQTMVEWTSVTHLHWYPWEKFYAIFMDKLTGPGYEMALEGLKKYVEGN